jgi:hypothetical protein
MNAKDEAGRRTKMKKMTFGTLIGSVVLATSIAAHAQAVAPDPNLGLTTTGEEALIAPTGADAPQLAVAVDPNIGPSTSAQEALIPPSSQDAVQLAVAPDPNFGEPNVAQAPEMQASQTSGSNVAMH